MLDFIVVLVNSSFTEVRMVDSHIEAVSPWFTASQLPCISRERWAVILLSLGRVREVSNFGDSICSNYNTRKNRLLRVASRKFLALLTRRASFKFLTRVFGCPPLTIAKIRELAVYRVPAMYFWSCRLFESGLWKAREGYFCKLEGREDWGVKLFRQQSTEGTDVRFHVMRWSARSTGIPHFSLTSQKRSTFWAFKNALLTSMK